MSVNNLNGEAENVENEEEELDPRIQLELERLNKSCADVNKLENELEEAKSRFILSKNKQLERLGNLQKKYGSSIIKAKPYYEALSLTENLQIETQKAVHEFQKTNSLYKTAKETLAVAENSLEQGEIPDAWQEHLSLTIKKISLSKEAADKAEIHHRAIANAYQTADKRVQFYEKEIKKHITKSQLYYDEKSRWNIQMETQKSHIHEIEQTLIYTKKIYKEAMSNLSMISEEIHNRRKLEKKIKRDSLMIPTNTDSSSNEAYTKFDSLVSSETHSLSNESQESSENEAKKLKNLLNLYNLTLPDDANNSNNPNDPQRETNYHSATEMNTTAKTYEELKNCEASEYISLGLNSTASNSRSESPSNSLETDIEWNNHINDNNDSHEIMVNNHGNQLKNSQHINSQLITSSSTPSFSNSSVSRHLPEINPAKNELPNKFFNHLNKTPHMLVSDNLGMSSLTLETPDQSSNHQKTTSIQKKTDENIKNSHEFNKTPNIKSASLQVSNHRSNKTNKVTKNETPLLSFVSTNHFYR